MIIRRKIRSSSLSVEWKKNKKKKRRFNLLSQEGNNWNITWQKGLLFFAATFIFMLNGKHKSSDKGKLILSLYICVLSLSLKKKKQIWKNERANHIQLHAWFARCGN